MSRAENLRQHIRDSGSPLADTSLSQRSLKLEQDGIIRVDHATLIKRHQRHGNNDAEDYERQKVERVAERVARALSGDDGVDLVVFSAEVRYLKRSGYIKKEKPNSRAKPPLKLL